MFAVVALLCLYLGTNNIKKAFVLAPFGEWQMINWMLMATGIILLVIFIPLIRQALKDYNNAKNEALQKEKEKEEAKKRMYSLEEDEDEV